MMSNQSEEEKVIRDVTDTGNGTVTHRRNKSEANKGLGDSSACGDSSGNQVESSTQTEKDDIINSENTDSVSDTDKTSERKDVRRHVVEWLQYWQLCVRDITSWDSLIRLLCRPTDPASLGVLRFLYGLLVVLDAIQERGMAKADMRWGSTTECRFPLISGMKPLSLQWMMIVYLMLVTGAIGIMFGFVFKLSCFVYMCSYWYLYSLDTLNWNNHSYLFGVLAFLFFLSDANRYWSIDALLKPELNNAHVPKWNYVIIRAQIFLVYFIAGLKKLDPDWVFGYSMSNLGRHWVFYPFSYIMTQNQIDQFIVHLGGLAIDLFVGFFLVNKVSRGYALTLSSMFHVMNSFIFSIGMFPYAMLAIQLVFCEPDWPRKYFDKIPSLLRLLTPDNTAEKIQPSLHCVYTTDEVQSMKAEENPSRVKSPPTSPNNRHKFVATFCLVFIAWECFLPYSHGITKGTNSWTQGLYGYSWDMMVHSWRIQHIRITYKDKDTNQSGFLHPKVWGAGSRRWSNNAKTIKQYANCIAENLRTYNINNVELYFDIWRSMNQRFQQRIVDPRVDIMNADWSLFTKTPWMLPLLADLSDWRPHLEDMVDGIMKNDTTNLLDVVFVADFPGLDLESYVPPDYANTTITVLNGQVVLTIENNDTKFDLGPGESMKLPTDTFHRVETISSTPSSYMYKYANTTAQELNIKFEEFERELSESKDANETLKKYSDDPHLPVLKEYVKYWEPTEKQKDDRSDNPFYKDILKYIKRFFYTKYFLLKRSIRLINGAVYCFATNGNYTEFLNATYAMEEMQFRHRERTSNSTDNSTSVDN